MSPLICQESGPNVLGAEGWMLMPPFWEEMGQAVAPVAPSLLCLVHLSLLLSAGLLRVPLLALQKVGQTHHPAAPLPDYSPQDQADQPEAEELAALHPGPAQVLPGETGLHPLEEMGWLIGKDIRRKMPGGVLFPVILL